MTPEGRTTISAGIYAHAFVAEYQRLTLSLKVNAETHGAVQLASQRALELAETWRMLNSVQDITDAQMAFVSELQAMGEGGEE